MRASGGKNIMLSTKVLFFKSLPKDICSLLLEEVGGTEGDRKREREGERHRCERETPIDCLLLPTLTRDLTRKLGTSHDWELNPWPFGLRDDAPTNSATWARANKGTFWLTISLSQSLKWLYTNRMVKASTKRPPTLHHHRWDLEEIFEISISGSCISIALKGLTDNIYQ